jgi:hypothetical protein
MDEEYTDLIPVEGHSHLGRDSGSNAIINLDQTGYDAYIKAREERKKKDKDLDDLRQEVQELKDLLKVVVSQLDK